MEINRGMFLKDITPHVPLKETPARHHEYFIPVHAL